MLQAVQEVHAAVLALIRINVHEHPACGPVDGNEQIAPGLLVRYLRQVLGAHVHEAWFIVLDVLTGYSLSAPESACAQPYSSRKLETP